MRDKTNNPKDIEIIEELERLAMNESFIYDYDHEAVQKKIENLIRYEGKVEGIQEGIERGIITGRKEGIRENQIQIVKNMLSKAMDIKLISELTGLSIKEIKNI